MNTLQTATDVISHGQHLETSRAKVFHSLFSCFHNHNGRQRRITAEEKSRKKKQKLADEYPRTKRTLKRAQAVLDRLDEELSGACGAD